MGAIYQWMKNIVYFLLFVGVLRNLTGREYQKYSSLTVGLCLVLLVASPVMRFLTGDKFQGNFQFFLGRSELEEIMAWEEIRGDEKEWKESVLEQYRELVKEQVAELVKEREVAVDRVEFVMEEERIITGMTVWLERKEKKEKSSAEAVEAISITDIVISLEKEGNKEETASGENAVEMQLLKLAIKTELADFYDMDASHINIIIY